jgi:hypothetical protein
MEVAASVSALQEPQVTNANQNGSPNGLSEGGTEARLIDFLATVQAHAQQGQQLGNPTALGSEAAGVLRGYLERTQELREKLAQKARAMEGAENQPSAGSATSGSSGATHLASLQGQGQSVRTDASGGITPGAPNMEMAANLDKVLEMLSSMLGFALETTLIGTATSNLSKATTTLLHGQ